MLWELRENGNLVTLTFHWGTAAGKPATPCGAISKDGESALVAWVLDQMEPWHGAVFVSGTSVVRQTVPVGGARA